MSRAPFRLKPHSIAFYMLRNSSLETVLCNFTRTQNHLVLKRTLDHLVKLATNLSCVASTYLYIAFDCMLLLCHVRASA